MACSVSAITTGPGGLVSSADASGNLNLVSGTTTIVAVTSAGVAVTGTLTASGTTTLVTPILGTPASGNLANCTGAVVASLSTASGSAPSYSARAWVNFNGTGVVAIRASGNVTSITDDGTGLYTVNFTNAMPDANYCVAGAAAKADGGDNNTNMRVMGRNAAVAQTTSAVAVGCYYANSNLEDGGLMCVAIFR